MILYNEEQQSAIESCIDFINNGNSKEYYLIEGKAGTGKTTVIKEVIKNFPNKKIIAGALSHKAKYIIKESIEKGLNNLDITYSSVASMLSLQLDLETGVFKKDYNKKNGKTSILNFDVIIIDEASMINEEMIDLIFKEKNLHSKVIFLGDIGQLPPIRTKKNPYYFDWDDIDLGKNSPIFQIDKKSKLLIRVRQGEESPILPFADYFWENSLAINPVKNPANIKYRKTLINDKGALIFINETREIFKTTLEIFDVAIKENKPNLIKYITYRNKTRHLINLYIHRHFFGNDCNTFQKGELIIFNDSFGDFENSSEYQIVNRYPDFIDNKNNLKLYSIDVIFDNKLHQLVLLHPDSNLIHENLVKYKFKRAFDIKKDIDNLEGENNTIKKRKELNILYKNLLIEAWDEKRRFPMIDYGYAISTHKSQGSTYDIAVIHEQDIASVKMIDNKQKSQSIYTAITRSKNISIIISSERIYNEIEISEINLNQLNQNINNGK